MLNGEWWCDAEHCETPGHRRSPGSTSGVTVACCVSSVSGDTEVTPHV